MKKLLTLAALALFTLAMASMAYAEVTLSYSNFFPPTHVQSQLADEWCKEVEKRTNGQVKVNYYPGGTLTQAKQTYDGVMDGIADIGMSALAYSRGRFPAMAAVDLPLGYKSGVQATMVANAVFDEFKPREFRDVQPMFFHAHGPGLLFTTPKPVTSLADLKGMKIRSTGNSAQLVKALGGTPVAQSMSTCYQSLQKGVVDGSMHPMESNKGWKLAEVVKYGTNSQAVAYTTTFFVVMNKDKWDELGPENQKIISEINAEFSVKHGQAWDEADKAGLEFFQAQGGTMVELTDADAWVQKALPVMDEYKKDAAKKKVDGKAVLDFILTKMAN